MPVTCNVGDLACGKFLFSLFMSSAVAEVLLSVHAVIIFITLTLLGFVVYATGHVIGSPTRMYDNLQHMAQVHVHF